MPDTLPAELAAALDRMDALLDPALDLLTAGPDSATAKGSRDDMRAIRDALAARASPNPAAVPEGWRQLLQQSEENFVRQFGTSVSAAWVYRDLEELLTSQPAAVDVGAAALDAAAKKLAECMDYPWDHMPEQGRNSMRQHAKAVIDAARATQQGATP